MSPKLILLLASAFLPATAMAQSNGSEKSPDQIRCELEGNCAAATDPSADEEVATRSWSWGARTTSQPRTAPVATTAAPRSRPSSSNLAAASSQSSSSSSRQRVRQQAAPVKPKTSLAITFAPGTAAFTPDGRAQADKVFLAMNTPDLSNKRFLIAGHTDSAGNAELNRELSRRRAQALADYLVDKGLSRKSFRVRGYGYDQPLDGVSPTSPANRRVEIVKLN